MEKFNLRHNLEAIKKYQKKNYLEYKKPWYKIIIFNYNI